MSKSIPYLLHFAGLTFGFIPLPTSSLFNITYYPLDSYPMAGYQGGPGKYPIQICAF
jgi:hypothetical protein